MKLEAVVLVSGCILFVVSATVSGWAQPITMILSIVLIIGGGGRLFFGRGDGEK